jgi:phage portal protein BeeE
MTSLLRRIIGGGGDERGSALSFQQWVDTFNFNNVLYTVPPQQTLVGDREKIGGDFTGLVSGAYASNGIVFACCYARMLAFSEARFQFRQVRNGRPGNLFGTPALAPLEVPWENGTTGDLLSRMIQDVDLAGNAFVVRQGNYLSRLRPDWVTILLASRSDRTNWIPGDPDTEVFGYIYKPGGLRSGEPEMVFSRSMVAHFAPIPDPQAAYRGMSWMTPLIREIQADNSMGAHRQRFFENGATVNLVVKLPKEAAPTMEQFQEWVKVIREGHEGTAKAYRTMFLGMGADITPVGSDLQADFSKVQGAGEVRIATAARVPPTLLGISEGLQGSSLNAGNYQSAKRNFADGLLRPMWRNVSGSLASIIQVPAGAELWYDDRDIQLLKDDARDTAEVQQMQASAIKSLIDAGYEPAAIIDAVVSDDFSRLASAHTGMTSVQLLPPGTSKNGSANGSAAASNPTVSA